MTLTFNPDKYKDLLSLYQPKIIKTEAENEQALAIVEDLMHRPQRSLEENELYQLLILLIEKFEQDYYSPEDSSDPESMLRFLMEQRDLKPIDLMPIFGSEALSLAILQGEQIIQPSQAQALGDLFHVTPALFYSDRPVTPC
jgi:HTH-type transcriptional regulator/antitoxin HigA